MVGACREYHWATGHLLQARSIARRRGVTPLTRNPYHYSPLTRNSCQGSQPLFSAGMATKAQHSESYQLVPPFLRALREAAGLTQRSLGERLGKPQSWVHNCESANRRVDVTEFIAWARACHVEPQNAFARFLKSS